MSFDTSSVFTPRHHNDRYLIRLLLPTDDGQEYCQLLSHLTTSPKIPQIQFQELLAQMQPDRGYYVLVVIDEQPTNHNQLTMVASVTLLVEQKIIHGGGRVAHIEDVVVSSASRGCGLAKVLLTTAQQLSEQLGCYKIILDCDPDLVGFYQKLGYFQKGVYLRQNL